MRILGAICVVLMGVASSAFALDAPRNVRATDGASWEKVTVTWDAVPGAERYIVTRNSGLSSQTGKYEATVTGTSWDDVDCEGGVICTYRVRAVKGGETSGYSDYETGWCSVHLVLPNDDACVAVVAGGGSSPLQSVDITCNTTWLASSMDDWIEVLPSAASGFRDGVLKLDCRPNDTGVPRRGTVKVAAKGQSITFDVVQGTVGPAELSAVDAVGAYLYLDGGTVTQALDHAADRTLGGGFVAVADEQARDGIALRNGPMRPRDTALMRLKVTGEGSLSFKWKKLPGSDDIFEVFTSSSDKLPSRAEAACPTSDDWVSRSFYFGDDGDHYVFWRVRRGSTADPLAGGAFLDAVDFTGVPQSLEIVGCPEFFDYNGEYRLYCLLTDSLGQTRPVHPFLWLYSTSDPSGQTSISFQGCTGSSAVYVRPCEPELYDVLTGPPGFYLNEPRTFALKADYRMDIGGGFIKTAEAVVPNVTMLPPIAYALGRNFVNPNGDYLYDARAFGGWRWTKDASADEGVSASSGLGTGADDLTFPVMRRGRIWFACRFENPAADTRLEVYADGEPLMTVDGAGRTVWEDAQFDVASTNGAQIACRFVAGSATDARVYVDNVRWGAMPARPENLRVLANLEGEVRLGWTGDLDAAYYRVYAWRPDEDFPGKPVQELKAGGQEVTDGRIRGSGTYRVRVEAVSGAGVTGEPAEIEVTVNDSCEVWSMDGGGLAFSGTNDYPWFVQSAYVLDVTLDDGGMEPTGAPIPPTRLRSYTAFQSGDAGDNESSTLLATVSGPGTLSFWWNVSSEQRYDRLFFLVDGEAEDEISGSGRESGDWRSVSREVGVGDHVFGWSYRKDGSVSVGDDAGWVADVKWTPWTQLDEAWIEGPQGFGSYSSECVYTAHARYETADGEVRDVEIPVVRWDVYSTYGALEFGLTTNVVGQTLVVRPPEEIVFADEIEIVATVVLNGEEREVSLPVRLTDMTFEEAFDADGQLFTQADPESWRITGRDSVKGDFAVSVGGADNVAWGSVTFGTTVTGAGTVSFCWRKDAGANRGRFYVDGMDERGEAAAALETDGATEWETVSIHVAEDGPHDLVWQCYGRGSDGGELFLDAFDWTPDAPSAWTFARAEIAGPDPALFSSKGAGQSEYGVELVYVRADGAEERREPCGYALWEVPGGSFAYNDEVQVGRSICLDGARGDEVTLVAVFTLDGRAYEVRRTVGMCRLADPWESAVDEPGMLFEGYYTAGFQGLPDATAVGGSAAFSSNHEPDSEDDFSFGVLGGGRLSFNWKVSSQAGGDAFILEVDYKEVARISGPDTGWIAYDLDIPVDKDDPRAYHFVKFIYRKNGDGVSAGEDRGGLDNIVWKGVWKPRVMDGSIVDDTGMGVIYGGAEATFAMEFWLETERWVRGLDHPVDWSFGVDSPASAGAVSLTPGPLGTCRIAVSPGLAADDTLVVTGRFVNALGEEKVVALDMQLRRTCPLATALDNEQAAFTCTGDGLWVGQFGDASFGGSSARCIGLEYGRKTTLATEVEGPGTLTCDWYLASGESVLSLRVDGVERARLDAGTSTFDWEEASVAVEGEGVHLVEWVALDGASGGTLMVDHVRWTGAYPVSSTETSRGVAYAWLESYGIDPNGDAWETAQNLPAANGVNTVRDCYLLGLDPTNETSVFTTKITMVDGEPQVTWSPDRTGDPTAKIEYVIEGKTGLDDPVWEPADIEKHRFFKVRAVEK